MLGGRLRLRQPRSGHRVGHDAILLAAATGAQAGDHVVDLGAGVGAAGLALAMRVSDATVTLVEIDPELAALAAETSRATAWTARASGGGARYRGAGGRFRGGRARPGSADHVLMNPPFNDPAGRTSRPIRGRRLGPCGARRVLGRLGRRGRRRLLRSAGTLTMIWRADGLAHVLAALAASSAALSCCPCMAGAGEPAIRILGPGRKGSRAPLALLPGLVLNDRSARPTPEAEAILRHAAALPMAS